MVCPGEKWGTSQWPSKGERDDGVLYTIKLLKEQGQCLGSGLGRPALQMTESRDESDIPDAAGRLQTQGLGPVLTEPEVPQRNCSCLTAAGETLGEGQATCLRCNKC